jgi:3-hydroxyisobutyrate dehydrogenase-like beta-hydroxyacid dehydrogenase
MVTCLLAEGLTVGVWNRPLATLEPLADPEAKNAAAQASLARDHGLLMTWRRSHHLFWAFVAFEPIG